MQRSRRQKTKTIRRDVQGLRALAVLLVFANHMVGWPAGGFAGVDVFFVISGFLITGLLLREYDRTGHISARKFYLGRLKRIVPSATLVLLFVIAFSWALFTKNRAVAVTWDALWALLFGANWNFAAAGTDYFQADSAVSPLQHYWSLSVEEQFYFVWPWLLLGLLVIFARFMPMNDRLARTIAGSTIGLISIASFAWAFYDAAANPTVAYFSTFTRAWELGVGALIAVASPLLVNIPRVLRTVLAYIGLVGIIASCILIPTTAAWPAPWALLPVLATGVVIASGVGEEARFIQPLTNPVSVYIGDISYSLYLWHFPAIIFGHALYPDAGSLAYFGILAAGFALATAQYYALERPLWKSPLGTNARPGAWKTWRSEQAHTIQYGLVGGLAALSVAVVGVAFVPSPQPVDTSISAAPETPEPSASPSAVAMPAVAEIDAALRTSLSLTTWPELTPSIDDFGPDSWVDAWVKDGCLALHGKAGTDPLGTLDRCVYGPKGGTPIALVGDSIAISYLPAIQVAYPKAEIHVMTMAECPFATVTVKKRDGSAFSACDPFHAAVADRLAKLKPELTIMSQAVNSEARVSGSTTMREGMDAALKATADVSGRVIVLPPPPPGKNLADCYSATSGPAACAADVSAEHIKTRSSLIEDVERTKLAELVDTDQLFCVSGRCPAMADGVVIRADVTHLTQDYAAKIGPALGELIDALK
ncbi:acyltransferase family protein [Microbacterium sp.]|uniref:acyltransferase family protein n=1 Tax=Microbacterium sp. TaxID=51671 RepID=UPI0033401813